MDKNLKEHIVKNAIKRLEIRQELRLWEHLSTLGSLFEQKTIMRESLVMMILEEVALEAWELGSRHGLSEGLDLAQMSDDKGNSETYFQKDSI